MKGLYVHPAQAYYVHPAQAQYKLWRTEKWSVHDGIYTAPTVMPSFC